MRQIGSIHIHDTPGQFGITFPEDGEVIGVEADGGLVRLTYLAPVAAPLIDVDIAIVWAGGMVTPDMQYVGRFRRTDGRDYYVFIRRD